jgi:peptidoglycan/xylan/chitin deacetylase (PgdA/CDA1 family)
VDKKMPRIELPRFPNNKRIAVTLSFDDGVVTDLPLIEKLNAFNLKATFNLNSGLLGSGPHGAGKTNYLHPKDVAKAYAGHEVAIHTVTHPHLDRLDRSSIIREVFDDLRALEDLVQYPVRGMAYPFGGYNDTVIDILRALGITYARTTESATQPVPPKNPLALATTAHQYDSTHLAKWNEWYTTTWFPQDGGVFFIWGHSYEFHINNDWPALDRILKPLANKPDVWYCTNIQLFNYEAARQSLQLAANGKCAHNPSSLPVTLLIDNKPLDLPPGQTIALP